MLILTLLMQYFFNSFVILLVKYKYIILLLVILFALQVRAQYDPSFSHYFDMEPSFNAASVGKDSKLNINAAYNLSLAGFDNNPKTMYASAHTPFAFLKGIHGAGVLFMNDQIGLFKHTRLEVQYAPKFKFLGGVMSIGVQAGLLSENFDGSKLDIENSNDPAFVSSSVTGNSVDLSAGIYYLRGPFSAGLSVQHINAPIIDLGERNEIEVGRTYYFTSGYNIKLRNPFLTIKPSVLVRSDLVGYRADMTGRLVYTSDNRMMYMGFGYSPTNSVTLYVGGNLHGVILGYSYEYYTSGISPINGSHELFLGYQIDINLGKKGKNKHQSVRIL